MKERKEKEREIGIKLDPCVFFQCQTGLSDSVIFLAEQDVVGGDDDHSTGNHTLSRLPPVKDEGKLRERQETELANHW